jgi:polysaccharide export outer membrane protein
VVATVAVEVPAPVVVAAVEQPITEEAIPVVDAPLAKKKPSGTFTIEELKAMAEEASASQPSADQLKGGFDPLKYRLGPDDVIEVSVMRHPEFSGIYPVNQEGKIQYKFVGDMLVNGMTKSQLENTLTEIVSKYVIAPEVNVTVTEYKSKVFYVLGEVGAPGKYYMRSEDISVRDAVVMAGLPTQAAAMRKTRIITPNQRGGIVRTVDIYALLYGGDLKKNLVMKPGDFLYVPSTVMAKVFRVISPASSAVATVVSPMSSISSAKTDNENVQR